MKFFYDFIRCPLVESNDNCKGLTANIVRSLLRLSCLFVILLPIWIEAAPNMGDNFEPKKKKIFCNVEDQGRRIPPEIKETGGRRLPLERCLWFVLFRHGRRPKNSNVASQQISCT
jgi:hypothetical protein